MIWVTLITALLIAVHLLSASIGRRLDTTGFSVRSLGGGMAVAYVFLHLLPELEKGHQVLGHAVHVVALAGFVGFSAAEHWTYRMEGTSGRFKLHIFLQCVYNWLLIYMLPEAVEAGPGAASLMAVTLSLHLFATDYALRTEFPQEFQSWGRWALAAALLGGLITDIFYEPVDPYVADTCTALLAGFLLCNVFRDEAPEPSSSHLGWFIAGVVIYTILSL